MVVQVAIVGVKLLWNPPDENLNEQFLMLLLHSWRRRKRRKRRKRRRQVTHMGYTAMLALHLLLLHYCPCLESKVVVKLS